MLYVWKSLESSVKTRATSCRQKRHISNVKMIPFWQLLQQTLVKITTPDWKKTKPSRAYQINPQSEISSYDHIWASVYVCVFVYINTHTCRHPGGHHTRIMWIAMNESINTPGENCNVESVKKRHMHITHFKLAHTLATSRTPTHTHAPSPTPGVR